MLETLEPIKKQPMRTLSRQETMVTLVVQRAQVESGGTNLSIHTKESQFLTMHRLGLPMDETTLS
jgi:hypothetical protein